MKVVFLYTELAGYTLSCFDHLFSKGIELLVYSYPTNKEAPFHFKGRNHFNIIDRKTRSGQEIISEINSFHPDLIICSGWIDKEYVKICGHFKKKKIKTVLCLDNHWRFSPRQIMAVMASPFFIKPNFEMAWVPGKIQKKFVSKLGFRENKIFEGFYCADTSYYDKVYERTKPEKKKKFPKRFIYIGRYYEFKGLNELWKAFTEFNNKNSEWELWCLGTGDLEPFQHPRIKHFGFVQPEEMEKYLSETGVFILPSRFEPWGVVVHEMAAAGFPMILSNAVGAGEVFLDENSNGFTFQKGNADHLKGKMEQVARMTDEELNRMAEKSHQLSKQISLTTWVETIKQMLNSK